MVINLTSIRDISYRINDTDNIKSIEYIITFPSGYKYTFPIELNKATGELTIHLPILKDIIKDEFNGIGFIQIKHPNGTKTELYEEPIKFINAKILNLNNDKNTGINFNNNFEPINKMALKTNEVLVSHSNTLNFIMSNIDRDKK